MINTSVNLGQCAVKISAEIKKDSEQNVLKKGIEKLAYHASASKVFHSKGYARDEKFSDILASDLRKGLELVISPFCDSLNFEITEKPASKKAPSIADVLSGLGLSMEDIEKLAASKAKAAKVELELVESEDEEDQEAIEQ